MMVDPSILEPNPWNTNILTPENEAKLEQSIKRLGFFRPAIVREFANSLHKYQILGGAHRVEIAVKLGMTAIPVVNLGAITDLEAQEIGIADNARYGVDDTIAFAELIKQMGNSEELKDFLPYTESDFADLFSSTSIDLDNLLDDMEDNFENVAGDETRPDPAPKPTKTHSIIRFKVANKDAETITRMIEDTKKVHGYTSSDELTNAGDALAHMLLGVGEE
jgi:ParB-like chromosome segregation protein Spo0J